MPENTYRPRRSEVEARQAKTQANADRTRTRGQASRVTEGAKRWKNRTVREEPDLLGSFDAKSSSDLMYTAIRATQRLRDNGREILGEGSEESRKWRDSCNDLWNFLNAVEMKKHRGLELKDVMREFACCFEHSEFRIRQLLFGATGNQAEDRQREQTGRWLAFTYRACTYAILAVWFDYKRETTTGHIHVNLRTGEIQENWSHKPMRGPSRRHRRGGIYRREASLPAPTRSHPAGRSSQTRNPLSSYTRRPRRD